MLLHACDISSRSSLCITKPYKDVTLNCIAILFGIYGEEQNKYQTTVGLTFNCSGQRVSVSQIPSSR